MASINNGNKISQVYFTKMNELLTDGIINKIRDLFKVKLYTIKRESERD